jgi:CBS domain-containing protein
MSDFKFNPSSAFIVDAGTPISKCVEAMRDHGFGAVLVTEPGTKRPGSIFTERDVVRWIDQIMSGGGWVKPVHLLASRPLITIALDDIDRAEEIMIKRGIRHLPITHTDDSGETVMSMISMRDIVRNHFLNREREMSKAPPRPLRIGVISESSGMRSLIRKISADRGNATVEAIAIGESARKEPALDPKVYAELDHLIYDLDQSPPSEWAEVLKAINSEVKHPVVTLVYDPGLHSEAELEVLAKLGLSGRFSAYTKPLHYHVMLHLFSGEL